MKLRKRMISTLLVLCLINVVFIPLFTDFAADIAIAADVLPPEPWGPTPSPAQLAYQKEEMSAFFHFGMNTFTGREWGTGTETPSQYTLSSIDAEQWVKPFKDAGFGRVILVAKHHDGFCNWPTAMSDRSVANTPGKIDVMAAVSAAVTKLDMGMGVYLSPWDMGCPHYGVGNGTMDYNDYYMAQLREILGNPNYGNNGKFVEIWMDGAKGSGAPQPYYFTKDYVEPGQANWRDVITEYIPDPCIFAPYGDTVRWNGTESGISGNPCWNKINWADQRSNFDRTGGENVALVTNGQANGVNWSVPEADVSLVSGWFASTGTPKTLKALGDIYFGSVGRSSILLLNAAPGTNGRVSDAQVNRINEFGNAIKNTFATNLAAGATVTATATRGNAAEYKAANVIDGDYDTYWTMDDGQTTGSVTIDLGTSKTFDVVSLQEYIPLGQRISSYSVETYSNGTWRAFGGGQTIGYKALVRGYMTTASMVRVNISASQAVPLINAIGVYKTAVADWEIPMPAEMSLTTLKPASGSGNYAGYDPGNAVDGNEDTRWASTAPRTSQPWLEVDLLQTTRFNRFYISQLGVAATPSRIGTFEIQYRDNPGDPWKVAFASSTGNPTWNLLKTQHYTGVGTFETAMGRYVRLFISSQLAAESSIWQFDLYYDAEKDYTIYSLDKGLYNASDSVGMLNVVVKRTDINANADTIRVYTEPGTGVHGKVFNHIDQVVKFGPNELEKVVPIQILNYLDGEASKEFYIKLELVEGDGGYVIGDASSRAVIWNSDYDHEYSREYSSFKLPAVGSKTFFCHKMDYAYPAERQTNNAATDGYVVGWLGYTSRGDGRLRLWYDAPVSGDYTVKLRYYTGRTAANPNAVKWQGPNIVSGMISAPGPGGWYTPEFILTVTKAGPGYIEFYNENLTAPTEMPNLDYMTFTAPEIVPPAQWGPAPSAAQLRAHKVEMFGFIHFGMNTFTGIEWGTGQESPSRFTLTNEQLDTDQWATMFKNAGFGRLMFVGKHHDGFCNWPSAFTEHSVKSAPGKVDVLGRLSESCTKIDLDMGLYMSPWDVNSPYYGDSSQGESVAYNNYFMNQLDEIMGNPAYGNNGKWVEMWLDGAKGNNVKQDYWFRDDWPIPDAPASWESVYKKYNPEIVTFGNLGDEMRWIGNENGIAGIPYWNKINYSQLRADYLRVPLVEDGRLLHRGDPNGADWSIGECDFRITSGWFAYSDTNLKTLRALGDIYFQSIGRGAVFHMNVAPGPSGRISNAQEARVSELGDAIRDSFETDLAQGATVTASSYRNSAEAFKPANVIDGDYDTYWTMDNGQTTGSIEVDLGGNKYFDVVSIQEYIPLGQRISRYTVEVYVKGAWQRFGLTDACQTIGYKALVRDFPVTASKVRVNITASQAVPLINSIGVYKMVGAFELPGPGLLAGKPITASTTQGTTNVASRAIDSVYTVPTSTTSTSMSMSTPTSTYWGAATAARAATLDIDAGSVIAFNKLSLFEFNAGRITSYQIEYRNSTTEDWKVAYVGGAIGGETVQTFPTAKGRYIRLNILTATNTPNISNFGLFYDAELDIPKAWGPTPAPEQLAYQKEEMSAFIHFGMDTFTDKERGDGKELPSQFALTSIDTDQWVRTFKEAGFSRLILVAKHHDGFCNWPSKLTTHSVASSPGQIDVVGEVSKSVTKYGMDMGIYMSPWDVNSEYYGAGNDGVIYNNFFMDQMEEIFGNPEYGNNGKFVEFWMDGAKASNVVQPYFFTSAYVEPGGRNWRDTATKYNPQMLFFAPYGDNVRWGGSENGMAGIPNWNRINWADQKTYFDARGGENVSLVTNGQAAGVNWSVPEADVSITSGWFTHSNPPKTLRQLGDIYFGSVGRSSVLLLNAPPGKDGRLSAAIENRITEFGNAVRESFKTDLAQGAPVTASSVRGDGVAYKPENVTDGDYDTYWTTDDGVTTGSLEVDLGGDVMFDVVSIQEYIPLGQRISRYTVEVYVNGAWQTFGVVNNCQTIGYKALVRNYAVIASKVRVNITAAQANPLINTIGVYLTAVDAFKIPHPSLITAKPITASSTQGTTNVASRAVDGGLTPLTTYWGALTAARNGWLEVDAGAPITFNKLWLFEYNANRITSYQIEYRNDPDEEWKVAYAGGAFNGEVVAFFQPVTAQYVRLNILAASNTPNISHFGLYYVPYTYDLSVSKSSNSATATLKVLNYNGPPLKVDVMLIIAQYNSAGKLVATISKPIEYYCGDAETLTLDAVNAAACTFKAFLWDSEYIPLCDAATG